MSISIKSHMDGLKRELDMLTTKSRCWIIFGGGATGQMIFNILAKCNYDKNVVAFCDSDVRKHGNKIVNLNIDSYDNLSERYPDALYLVSSLYKYQEIAEFLSEKKAKFYIVNKSNYICREISNEQAKSNLNPTDYREIQLIERTSEFNENIEKVRNLLFEKKSLDIFNAIVNLRTVGDWSILETIEIPTEQYFINDILNFTEHEIFVDLGAYLGDSIKGFVDITNNKYKQIISFEPCLSYYKILNKYIIKSRFNNVMTYNLGTWNELDVIRFEDDMKTCPKISKSGEHFVNVDSLDNLLLDIPVTFIKMDIEGAEKNTILGAKELIRKYKPKLAVCIYHKTEDLYELPLLLKEIVPEYKFFIRHHSHYITETVLYALI